jgi:acetolactate synthase I/II/III large subunit
MNLAATLARAFLAEGTERVFTVMGSANMEWLAEIAGISDAVTQVRHELVAVAAADGYSRITGRVGIASVTHGPGLTHAATSIRAAVGNGTPMIVFTGHFAHDHHIQYVDQVALIKALGAQYLPIRTAHTALEDVRRAFYLARSTPGPVVLGVSSEFRADTPPDAADYVPATSIADRSHPIEPPSDKVAAIAQRLRTAKRPVILAGRGLAQSGVAARVQTLARTVGALTATTLPAQGWLEVDEFHLGVSGYFSDPEARELLRSADLVLALGSQLDRRATSANSLYQNARMILVDHRLRPTFATATVIDEFVSSDAGLFVEALLAEVPEGTATKWRNQTTARIIATGRKFANEPATIADGRLDPRRFLSDLDASFPLRRVLVLGAGHFFGFVVKNMAPPNYARLDTYSFAPIGQGIGTAIGAAFGTDEPVLLIEGDAGFHMNIQELETVRRLNLPILMVVMNNAALGAEYYHLPDRGYDGNLALLPEVDFGAIARGFGISSATIDSDSPDSKSAVDLYLASRKPMLLDVKISRDVVNLNWGGTEPSHSKS